jgi:integrase
MGKAKKRSITQNSIHTNRSRIDALICGNGKKTATFLQLLKETAMRCGEAKRLMWINVDFEKNIITLNDPEKGSNPRMWKVTQKLMEMLATMPKDSQRVFGDSSIFSMKTTFLRARKRLAAKLQNPRLLNISFSARALPNQQQHQIRRIQMGTWMQIRISKVP